MSTVTKEAKTKRDVFESKKGGHITLVQGHVNESLLDQFKKAKTKDIFICEGRPTLEAGKKLSQQMLKRKLKPTLIADNMSGVLFYNHLVKEVWLAYHDETNDDVLCDIGGLIFAVMAKRHNVPVYLYPGQGCGRLMGEQRDLLNFNGERVAPKGIKAYVPLIEWVPKKYITKVHL